VQSNGYWIADDILNWDVDSIHIDPVERRLDIYIRWKTGNAYYIVTGFDGIVYSWRTSTFTNIDNGLHGDISSTLPFDGDTTPAMWIFQDMRRTREFFLTNTHPLVSPGSLTAH
jgi:hypothetical protein